MLSTTLSALADPTRRSILQRLSEGPATVSELAQPFSITQQAISKHLSYLQRARLVDKRREGRTHICSLRPTPMKAVAQWAEEYRELWEIWEQSFQRLDALLNELQDE